jgi:hypothetical protein
MSQSLQTTHFIKLPIINLQTSSDKTTSNRQIIGRLDKKFTIEEQIDESQSPRLLHREIGLD